MKKTLFIGFALLACTCMKAQNIVTLCSDKDTKGNTAHNDALPIVEYGDSYVSVSSKYGIANVRIVIKDIMGRVIYNRTIDILPSGNILDIAEEYCSDKNTIELHYDKSNLFGFFDIPR